MATGRTLTKAEVYGLMSDIDLKRFIDVAAPDAGRANNPWKKLANKLCPGGEKAG